MCGYMPFGEDQVDPYDIYDEIITKKPVYPEDLKDKKAKKLMEQLLSRTPEMRLGGQYSNLKNHPWLEKFQWVSFMPSLYRNRTSCSTKSARRRLISRVSCNTTAMSKSGDTSFATL